jgi:Ca2+-transporting ATPase
LGVRVIILGVFLVSLYRGQGESDARALTFTTLIFANVGLILVNRSWSQSVFEGLKTPNKALWWVVAGALVILGFVLYIPYARTLFRFSFLHGIDIAICLAAGITSIVWFEVWKRLQFKKTSRSKQRRKGMLDSRQEVTASPNSIYLCANGQLPWLRHHIDGQIVTCSPLA